jgi:hypothetical protein
MEYKVWECKIVVPGDTEIPPGFDSPPRLAAQAAVEDHGIEVLEVLSGWGGKLTAIEKEVIEESQGERNL